MLPSGNLFYKTYENFINICENCSSDFARHRDKLNQILNELNSVDQKLIQLLDAKRVSLIHKLEKLYDHQKPV